MSKAELRDPMDLRPLPFVKAMPRWPKDSDAFAGFKDDIRDNGIKHPILVTVRNEVVDGWTRCLAAKDLQLEEVPVQIVADDEVQETIVRELCRRRNLTKGQLAYVAVPLLDCAFREALIRRSKNLRKGQQIPETNSVGFGDSSLTDWCRLFGFSDELLRQARELHKAFKDDPELRAEWEPKILDPEKPVSIGAARAGIAGADADQTTRKDGVEASQLEFWNSPFASLKSALPAWEKLDESKRDRVLKDFRKAALKMPSDLRAGMKEILEEIE